MLPRLVARDQLEAGNALLNFRKTIATVLGPAAAGAGGRATDPRVPDRGDFRLAGTDTTRVRSARAIAPGSCNA